MLEIEYQIHSDRDGRFRQATLARLLAMQKKLQEGLRMQHTIMANRQLRAGLQAVESAIALLRRYGV